MNQPPQLWRSCLLPTVSDTGSRKMSSHIAEIFKQWIQWPGTSFSLYRQPMDTLLALINPGAQKKPPNHSSLATLPLAQQHVTTSPLRGGMVLKVGTLLIQQMLDEKQALHQMVLFFGQWLSRVFWWMQQNPFTGDNLIQKMFERLQHPEFYPEFQRTPLTTAKLCSWFVYCFPQEQNELLSTYMADMSLMYTPDDVQTIIITTVDVVELSINLHQTVEYCMALVKHCMAATEKKKKVDSYPSEVKAIVNSMRVKQKLVKPKTQRRK